MVELIVMFLAWGAAVAVLAWAEVKLTAYRNGRERAFRDDQIRRYWRARRG